MIRSALLSTLPTLPLLALVSAATSVDLVAEADPLGRWASVHTADRSAWLRVTAGAGGLEFRLVAPALSGGLEEARRHLDALGAASRLADLLHLAGALPIGAVRGALDPRLVELDGEALVDRLLGLAREHDLVEGDCAAAEALVDLGLAARELRMMAEDRLAAGVAARVEAAVAAAEVRP